MKPLRVVAMNVVVLLALALTAELVFGGVDWEQRAGTACRAPQRQGRRVGRFLYPGGGEFLYRRDALGISRPWRRSRPRRIS